jgi:hypothetical protein
MTTVLVLPALVERLVILQYDARTTGSRAVELWIWSTVYCLLHQSRVPASHGLMTHLMTHDRQKNSKHWGMTT